MTAQRSATLKLVDKDGKVRAKRVKEQQQQQLQLEENGKWVDCVLCQDLHNVWKRPTNIVNVDVVWEFH